MLSRPAFGCNVVSDAIPAFGCNVVLDGTEGAMASKRGRVAAFVMAVKIQLRLEINETDSKWWA
eukprot:3058820-Pleurochrysis_carterae.AAC.2